MCRDRQEAHAGGMLNDYPTVKALVDDRRHDLEAASSRPIRFRRRPSAHHIFRRPRRD
jgi:hypothetical protein